MLGLGLAGGVAVAIPVTSEGELISTTITLLRLLHITTSHNIIHRTATQHNTQHCNTAQLTTT